MYFSGRYVFPGLSLLFAYLHFTAKKHTALIEVRPEVRSKKEKKLLHYLNLISASIDRGINRSNSVL